MRDTLKCECLVQALEDVVAARREHDEARDNYDGYSWGYFGHSYVKRMEDAAEEFEKRLNDYVKQQVLSVLQEEEV